MSPEPNPNTQRYLDLLHGVLEIAHDIAKDIHQQATTPPDPTTPPTPKPDYTIPIERIARTIRRTILLAIKVAEPPTAAPARAKPHRTAARKRILREVEDHINRAPYDDDHAEALQADLLDRLDSQELEDEIDTRPIPEIIIDIVRDLGLDSKWGPHRFKPRTQADIAALTARAAELIPTEPQPPRPAPPRPAPPRPAQARPNRKHPHPDPSPNPAKTGAATLATAHPPDG